MTCGCAVMHLSDAGRVSIIDQQDVATQVLLEGLLGLGIDPRLVDVCGGPGLAVSHYGWDRDADRAIADDLREVVHNLTDNRRHVLRCCFLWRSDAKSLRGELA